MEPILFIYMVAFFVLAVVLVVELINAKLILKRMADRLDEDFSMRRDGL